jgi:SynChlorMet cassette protein ScmC
LQLADGVVRALSAQDTFASMIVKRMCEIMRIKVSHNIPYYRFIIKTGKHIGYLNGLKPKGFGKNSELSFGFSGNQIDNPDNTATCQIIEASGPASVIKSMIFIACGLAHQYEKTGGLLLHGALAEHQGKGIILVGPGGGGKSTASRRLKPPWSSLSDDITLVVKDMLGQYWAHPWPTWSDIILGRGRSWDVQRAVPLQGLFFLRHSEYDRVEQIGGWQTCTLLIESTEQISGILWLGMENDQIRKTRLLRFENAGELTRIIPNYALQISKDGEYWQRIEETLDR